MTGSTGNHELSMPEASFVRDLAAMGGFKVTIEVAQNAIAKARQDLIEHPRTLEEARRIVQARNHLVHSIN